MNNCKEKGYEVGQVFERIQKSVSDINYRRKGEMLVLVRDDGSNTPYFVNLSEEYRSIEAPHQLDLVKRIYPPEELSKDVTVTCEGHEVTISRESAIKLGLCK